ncbi:MAG: hypothetical protein ABIP07_00195 [Sphingomicrobium sp.]
MVRLTFVAACVAISGCATPQVASQPLTGSWGGTHVGLTLDAVGGQLDYDCAAGTIVGPVKVDDAGLFRATGTHTPGTGGPVQQGHVPPAFPATYQGKVRGDAMTLSISVPSRGFVIGPYELRRGVDPRLMRCL